LWKTIGEDRQALVPRASWLDCLSLVQPHPRTSWPRCLARGCCAVSVCLPLAGMAVEPMEQFDVVLLQPGSVIDQRVEGGADALADYLRQAGLAAAAAVRLRPEQIPSAGFLVFAARPAGRIRLWLDFKPPLQAETSRAIERAIADAPTLPVKRGEVVFALRVGVWGARPPQAYAPAPQEWRDAAAQAGRKLDVESLVDRVWPP